MIWTGRLSGLHLDLVLDGGLTALDLVHDLGIGLDGQLAGEEEVSRVSVGYVDDVVLFALTFHVGEEYYFHGWVSFLYEKMMFISWNCLPL